MRPLMIVWNFRKRNFGGGPTPWSNGLLIEARAALPSESEPMLAIVCGLCSGRALE